MIKTKLIIFDLDGTLLNTIGVITKALNKALVDFGFETYEEEDVKSKVGYGPRRLIEDSVPNIDAELREKIYKNNRKYSDELTYDSEMFENIDKLLDGLEAKGIKIAINTNKSHHRAVIISEKIFSKWKFCDVIGYTEGDVGKPDPENGLSTLFRTIFIRSFFYILQVFYNLVIHEYECYCTNSHNQINLFLALQNF